MSVTPDGFRECIPAFADATVYPDEAVTFWLAIATTLLPTSRWGNTSNTPISTKNPPTTRLDIGLCMFTAHQLVLEKQANEAAKRGAAPGLNKGAISSDSVGSVSRSYDTAAGLEPEAGHWNLTNYGTRFVRLANAVGAGPITVGGGIDPNPLNGPAWPGPPWFPGWFG